MTNSRKKYLLKNTVIFTLGSLGSKIITFFLIPLYTKSLNTEQYGIIDLIITTNTVLVPILTLNICEAVMRFSLDENADREQISCIGQKIYFVSIFLTLALIFVFRIIPSISEYAVYTSLYIITFAASQLFLCDLRGKEMLLHYSVGTILETFLIGIFNVLFLVVFKLEIKGFLSAYIIAFTITAIYGFVVGKCYKSFSKKICNTRLAKEMIKFSVVLIPNSFMWWIINSSDRIMISMLLGVSYNGIYAISYKLPTLVSSFTLIFNRAWSYSAIKEEGALDETEFNNKIFQHLISIVMLMGIGLLVTCKSFLKIYVDSKFYDAWHYMPFLTIGFVFLTLADFIATSFTVHKDSYGFLFSGMIGAILNIILNYLLIPRIQIYGAAIATCISYISVFIFRLIYSRKYLCYNIMNNKFIVGTVLLIFSSYATFYTGFIFYLINTIVIIVAFFINRDVVIAIVNKIKK